MQVYGDILSDTIPNCWDYFALHSSLCIKTGIVPHSRLWEESGSRPIHRQHPAREESYDPDPDDDHTGDNEGRQKPHGVGAEYGTEYADIKYRAILIKLPLNQPITATELQRTS